MWLNQQSPTYRHPGFAQMGPTTSSCHIWQLRLALLKLAVELGAD